jgi:hypothetical protein
MDALCWAQIRVGQALEARAQIWIESWVERDICGIKQYLDTPHSALATLVARKVCNARVVT